jgi:predicted nuclease of restriction endonuclease-like (RecB) superfamily
MTILKKKTRQDAVLSGRTIKGYDAVFTGMVELLEAARRASARAVNTVMSATYWEVGRRIVECEQGGGEKAGYGMQILTRLSHDLTQRFRRGFSVDNLERMRRFYLLYPSVEISATLSRKLPAFTKSATLSRKFNQHQNSGREAKGQTVSDQFLSVDTMIHTISQRFPLSWSHYVLLLSVDNKFARDFYETEALRGGWSVRQLDRQISTLFYERTALSRDKAAMLTRGTQARPNDLVTPEEEIKDPLVLEFLNLKDEYSESNLEDAMIRHLEMFLLELGSDFTFVGRQKRLRIGNEWYRVDLVFFHRRLRCLVVVDLKLGKFTHADVGQMHLYLTYAGKHWTHPEENPPAGLILCAKGNQALAQYTLDTLPNKVLAAEYRIALPNEKLLVKEIERTRAAFEAYEIIRNKVGKKK